MPLSASVKKMSPAIPGVSGMPMIEIMASLSFNAIPVTGLFTSNLFASFTSVPLSVLKDERTCSSMLFCLAHSTALGCRTLAPNEASSSISS